MPSFRWSRLPQPNYGEYILRRDYYDRIYSLPYYLAGLILTTIGCGVALLVVRRVWSALPNVFWGAGSGTLAPLLFLALVSDVGTRLGAWRGPAFLLHHYYDPITIWALCKMFLPASALSGIVAVGKRLVLTRSRLAN